MNPKTCVGPARFSTVGVETGIPEHLVRPWQLGSRGARGEGMGIPEHLVRPSQEALARRAQTRGMKRALKERMAGRQSRRCCMCSWELRMQGKTGRGRRKRGVTGFVLFNFFLLHQLTIVLADVEARSVDKGKGTFDDAGRNT
jgi:hypothetical protein